MDRLIAEKLEVFGETALAQHVERVSAHCERLARGNSVMFVEFEPLGVVCDRTFVDDLLPVIFTSWFEPG